MFDTRHSNNQLRMIVLQTILKTRPQFARHLIVTADADGTVCLKGSITQRSERGAVVELVRDVPGVTHVFCNLAAEV